MIFNCSFKPVSKFVLLVCALSCNHQWAYAQDTIPDQIVEQSPESASLNFHSVQQLDELVSLGLTALALQLLKQEQARWPDYSANWYSLEHKRISLLTELSRWQEIINRVDALISEAIDGKQINQQIKQWFITQKVIAKLRVNKADEALFLVRQLIWDNSDAALSNQSSSAQLMPLWRRLVIRAYLLMGLDVDARKSLLRYQVDYQDDDQQWDLLRARVLMRTQRYSSVIDLLEGMDDVAALPLRLLAVMKEDPEKIQDAIKQARLEMADENISIDELWAYQYIVYQANLLQNNLPAACIELETLLSFGDVYSIMGEEYRVDGDDLWQAYIALGNSIGNKHQLLKGDDASWFKLAWKFKEKSLVSSRSVYAVIALHTSQKKQRQAAHKNLVNLLIGRQHYLELFNQLYVKSQQAGDLSNIAADIRHKLLDVALKKRKIELAGQLIKSLDGPKQGEDEFNWKMRKARVLVLQGEYILGLDALKSSIKALDELSEERIDHYLQVVFDLQSVKKHEEALVLFDLLKPEWLNNTHKREIFFWKAESYSELKNYEMSAMLYLQSAREIDPTMSDNWAKSARFKAAGALVSAHLYNDADTVYKSLLAITVNNARKSVIKQELQQIQLLRNADEKKQSTI